MNHILETALWLTLATALALLAVFVFDGDLPVQAMFVAAAATIFGKVTFQRPVDAARAGKKSKTGTGVTLMVFLLMPGCALFQEAKPVLRTVDDVATNLCAIFYGQKEGLSVEEAARAFCRTKKQVQPWLDEVLAAQQAAAAKQ